MRVERSLISQMDPNFNTLRSDKIKADIIMKGVRENNLPFVLKSERLSLFTCPICKEIMKADRIFRLLKHIGTDRHNENLISLNEKDDEMLQIEPFKNQMSKEDKLNVFFDNFSSVMDYAGDNNFSFKDFKVVSPAMSIIMDGIFTFS